MSFAELAPLILSSKRFPLFVDRVPNVQQGEEVGLWMDEAFMRVRGGVFLIQRTFPEVLNAQPGRDDQKLPRGVFDLGLQQHSPKRRVDRESSQVATQLCELAIFIQC